MPERDDALKNWWKCRSIFRTNPPDRKSTLRQCIIFVSI